MCLRILESLQLIFTIQMNLHQSSTLSKVFSQKTAHDIGPELTCAYCDFKTRREDNLKNHIRKEHEGVRYNC